MNAARDRKNLLETAGYWLTIASLVALILGVHFGHMVVIIPCLAVLVAGIVLNIVGENRTNRGAGR